MVRASHIMLLLYFLTACNQNTTIDKKTSFTVDSTSTLPSGKVTLNGELPSESSVPGLFDEMDYQQAVQCYLWGLPLVAFGEWQHIHENTFGATGNDLVVYTTYEDKLGILTANATTPYILTFIDLAKNGPTVVEMPAGKTAGGLSDFWQREVASIGEMGPDKGKGGKYILVPPGQKFTAPGFYIVPCNMMNMFFGFRALDPDPAIAQRLINEVRIYPYADRANPKVTRIVTPAGKKYLAVQPDGLAYWQRLHNILQKETVEERDRFFAAWLNNLGLKKGEAFNPTERQKKILIAAAERGRLMAISNSFKKRFDNAHHWTDRKWDYAMVISDPSQRTQNYDEFFERTSYFFEAVTYSKSMISKTPNVGQAYLGVYDDKNGDWLEGGNTYSLHLPANPPAVNFWSITVYDAATRCLIDNRQRNADLSSRKDLITNPDGSVDLFFGPTAPAGKEKNWVQTVAGKHWFVYLRLYGPSAAYFDKSWKMGDIEKMK